MKFECLSRLKHHQASLILGLVAAMGVLTLRGTGLLQFLELRSLDGLMAVRPAEKVDDRLVIVGIGEADLNWLQSPVLTDEILAQLLLKVKQQKPRVIGLDFYRNLPVQPGTTDLYQVFQSTSNLIGIEKVITDETDSSQAALLGNEVLVAADQVAASDVVVDDDGRVRRTLLFPAASGPRILEGLGFRLALEYLSAEGLMPDPTAEILQIEDAVFAPLSSSIGGYIDVDDRGYQILLNARAAAPIELVSLQDVLTGAVPQDLMRDRIVLIGSTALSSADVFYSNHSSAQQRDANVTFGIELHAELSSQVISRVLDGRPLLWSWPEWLETSLIILAAYLGIAFQRLPLAEWKRVLAGLGLTGGGVAISFGSLVGFGLWIPFVPLLLSFGAASVLMVFQRTIQLQLLADRDGLTQLANRRVFDESLQRAWMSSLQRQQSLSLILCDVDHFKLYNDAYGHQQGDECLRHVAHVIRSATNRSSYLAARYGGEEFVLLLPNTTAETALSLAEKIRQNIKMAQLPHKASRVSDHVTLSLGVTCLIPSMEVPMSSLVQFADLGLYRAKEQGRDRANLHLPEISGEA